MTPEDPHNAILIFISHAHEDRGWLERLLIYLAPLVRNHSVDVWSDRQIKPGARWPGEIQDKLSRAKVAILLISPQFLSSEFIHNEELPFLLARENEIQIIPIYAEAVARRLLKYKTPGGQEVDLSDFQGGNDPESPLDSLKPHEVGKVFIKVVEEVMKLVPPKDERTDEQLRLEELSSIRKEFLTAKAKPELQKALYRAEEYLSRHPLDPEVRLLRDQILKGIEWEEKAKAESYRPVDGGWRRLKRLASSPQFLTAVFAVSIAVTAAAYTSLPGRLVAFVTGRQTPTPTPAAQALPLQVTVPVKGEAVDGTKKYSAWGLTPHPDWHHYVLVKPKGLTCMGFIQYPEARVEEGEWNAWVKFGAATTPSGTQFEVLVIATRKELKGQMVCGSVPDSQVSAAVAVTLK